MIHLITPCSRLENLPVILESIKQELTGLEWRWWTVIDLRKAGLPRDLLDGRQTQISASPQGDVFAAGYLRNQALRQIDSGWVYDLDDDTVLHPNFRRLFNQVPAGKQAFWFDQVTAAGERICGPAGPYGTGIGAIRREAILEEWIPFTYDTDQDYCRTHLEGIPIERQVCFHEAGAYYNLLR